MRILAVTHSLQTNGAAYALVRLLVALRQAGASVSVLHTENHSLCEPLRAHGIEIISDCHADNFDVAIVNTMIDFPWVLQIAPHLPVLLWVHEGMSLLGGLSQHEVWNHAFRQSSRIVFYTPWQPEQVFRSVMYGVQEHRIRFVPMGVPQRPTQMPAPLRVGNRVVIGIGSIHPRKRPEDLLQAVLANADIGMQVKLLGNYEWVAQNNPVLMGLLRDHPHALTLVGESPASADMLDSSFVNGHMESCGIYASASADETFGIANLEAAAWGLPPAVSKLPCYEGIWKHGVNALMHPVGAADCLAWNLRALALDAGLNQRIAAAAMQTARRFGMDRFISSMTDVLQECITDRVMPA
jgi:glycosyltransferase involved in cell wall biosynthesis